MAFNNLTGGNLKNKTVIYIVVDGTKTDFFKEIQKFYEFANPFILSNNVIFRAVIMKVNSLPQEVKDWTVQNAVEFSTISSGNAAANSQI